MQKCTLQVIASTYLHYHPTNVSVDVDTELLQDYMTIYSYTYVYSY